VISRSENAVGTAERLLGRAEAPLDRLLPLLDRLGRTLGPAEVDALAVLAARRPGLLDAVDREVLPVLRTFENVAPDLHGVLEMVTDLHRLAAGLPGVRRLRKRGDDDVVHSRAEST
jgi:hypothetical protein